LCVSSKIPLLTVGKIYALYGPVEFTHKEIAQVPEQGAGQRDVGYKQVSFEDVASDYGLGRPEASRRA